MGNNEKKIYVRKIFFFRNLNKKTVFCLSKFRSKFLNYNPSDAMNYQEIVNALIKFLVEEGHN